MSKNAVRTVAIESLKVDVKFGPVEDKIEQLFTLVFSLKGDSNTQWETNYRFAKFSELNKQINHAAPNFISTDFPKAHRSRTALGMKIADEKLEERRNVLNLWLREVIANYDLLADNLREVLLEFIKVPNFLNISFATRDQIEEEEFKNTSEGTTPVGIGHFGDDNSTKSALPVKRHSLRSVRTSFTQQPISTKNSSDKLNHDNFQQVVTPVSVSALFLQIFEVVEILCDQCAVLLRSKTATNVLVITRSEKVIRVSSQPIGRTFLEDIFWSYGFRYYFLAVFVLFSAAKAEDYRFNLPVSLITVSLVTLFCIWYHDQHELHQANLRNKARASGSALQPLVTEFVQSLDVRYREFHAPIPGAVLRRISHVQPVKPPAPAQPAAVQVPPAAPQGSGSVLGQLFTPMKGQNGASIASAATATTSTESAPVAPVAGVEKSDKSALVPPTPPNTSVKEFPPVPVAPAGPSPKELQELAKKQMLAARKAFDDFEFTDLTAPSRAMFVDRKFTHNFQVRGATYLDDKKKVHPGSAMCTRWRAKMETDTTTWRPEGWRSSGGSRLLLCQETLSRSSLTSRFPATHR